MPVKTKPASRLFLGAVSLAVILFACWLNGLTPLFADDFSYSVSFVTKAPFTSLWEVLESQYLHYFSTNGRSVVHTLAQLLLWMGKPLLNVANGIAFWGLCMLICFHGLGSFARIKGGHLLAVFAALWFLTPHFGGSYLWVMGAANYLYSPQIILLFLIPYRLRLNPGWTPKGHDRPLLYAALAAAGGVLAGWTNENTSLALIVMAAAVLALDLLQKRKPAPWMWSGLAGCVAGCALLFLSPAQSKRLAAAGGMGGLSQWVRRFFSITRDVAEYLWLPVLVFAAALIVYLLGEKRARGAVTWGTLAPLAPAGVFVLGCGISVYSMVGSPEFPVWVWSSILALCLIAVLNMAAQISLPDKPAADWGRGAAALLLVAAVAVSCAVVTPELYRIKNAYDRREELIARAAETGEPLVVERITTQCTYSSYNLFNELAMDATLWPNTAIANYYGIPSIAARRPVE